MAAQREVRHTVNWKQAAGEALILLAGVLLALAAQAWWEAREEKREVQEYVDSLLVELDQNLAGLKGPKGLGTCKRDADSFPGIVCRHQIHIDDTVALIRQLQATDPPATPAEVQAALTLALFFDDYRPSTSALDNLVGAGGLSLLGSADVQSAVSSYRRAIDHHNVLQDELATFFLHEFVPGLNEKVPLLAVGFVGGQDLKLPHSAFAFDPDTLRGSLVVENLLTRRISAERDAQVFAERLAAATKELIGLLEDNDGDPPIDGSENDD